MSDRIKIQGINGASVGNDLKNCYFLNAGNGTYNFFDKNQNNPNNPILTGITGTGSFQGGFMLQDYPHIRWTMNVYGINDSAASGAWWGDDSASPEEIPGSGTFQAQAGGTVDAEPEASYEATA
jgi:hypothetical protein